MDFDVGSGHSHLLDEQAHEPLTLLEVESVHPLPNMLGERVDPVSKPMVDGEDLPFGYQCLSLLSELPMPLDDLLMPLPKLGELDGLHLVQINDPSSLAFGLLEAPIQTFQLRG